MTHPKRHPHADVIHAYAEEAKIQYLSSKDKWTDVEYPNFNPTATYRIKPKPIKVKRHLVGNLDINLNLFSLTHNESINPASGPVLGWVEYTLEEGKITNVEYEFY